MIAASLRDAQGDPIIELLLQKGADVNIKSVTGQVLTPSITPTCVDAGHVTDQVDIDYVP